MKKISVDISAGPMTGPGPGITFPRGGPIILPGITWPGGYPDPYFPVDVVFSTEIGI